MLVYVCSPYSGDIEKNVDFARWASRYTAEKGHTPIAPHLLLPQFMSEETEREQAMKMNMEILEKCEWLYVFCENGISKGMQAEIDKAEELGIKINWIARF